MSEAPEVLKPLKTWSHLAKRRKRPSEYEVVSVGLHYSMDNPDNPWELDPDLPMAKWYRKYRNGTPLKCDDWDEFRDPDELVYRTYNLLQDGQETHVMSLLDQFSDREHDKSLEPEWVETLAALYTPARYLYHTLQLGSSYIMQLGPSSTITNCGTYQTADCLRWTSHVAYRAVELSKTHPGKGFAEKEREHWENDEAWQGFRELMEKALVAWDWGEAFTAINLVAKPAAEEVMMGRLAHTALHNGDMLLNLIAESQRHDAERHRRWSTALVKMVIDTGDNRQVLQGWLDKWVPLADKAIDTYCAALPDGAEEATIAKEATAQFRRDLGLS